MSIESHSGLAEPPQDAQAGSGKKSPVGRILLTAPAESALSSAATRFALPSSANVCLLAAKSEHVRRLYETEALRGGWSVRQFGRQIDTQFSELTVLC